MSNSTYTDDDLRRVVGIVNEQTDSKLDLILEVVSDMQQTLKTLPTRDEFNELKSDVKIIRAAVTDTSHQVHDIDRRVTRLEAAA